MELYFSSFPQFRTKRIANNRFWTITRSIGFEIEFISRLEHRGRFYRKFQVPTLYKFGLLAGFLQYRLKSNKQYYGCTAYTIIIDLIKFKMLVFASFGFFIAPPQYLQ